MAFELTARCSGFRDRCSVSMPWIRDAGSVHLNVSTPRRLSEVTRRLNASIRLVCIWSPSRLVWGWPVHCGEMLGDGVGMHSLPQAGCPLIVVNVGVPRLPGGQHELGLQLLHPVRHLDSQASTFEDDFRVFAEIFPFRYPSSLFALIVSNHSSVDLHPAKDAPRRIFRPEVYSGSRG